MKKIIAFLSVICLILSLSIIVYAEAADEWRLSADSSVLYNGDDEYHFYDMGDYAIFRPLNAYVYAEYVSLDGWDYERVVADRYSDAVYLMNDTYFDDLYGVYVTENGAAALDSFMDGDFAHMRLTDAYMDSVINEAVVSEWDGEGGEYVTVEVTDLEDMYWYEVVGYDASGCLSHVHGAVYITDGGYLYINYDALDNSYFDSEGCFSYRKGTVSALVLDGADALLVDELVSEMEYIDGYTYEDSFGSVFGDPLTGFITFVFLWVIAGVVVPAAMIIAGLILSKTKKPHWLVLSLLGAIWLVLAIAIFVLLLIA